MKYRVHRIEVNNKNMQEKTEQFINSLSGEIIAIIPHVTPFFLIYGTKIDYILIIEKSRLLA